MDKILIHTLTIFLFMACTSQKPSAVNQPVTQGIVGEVIWLEGNQMPGPTPEGSKTGDSNEKKGIPVEREIHVYKLLNVKDTESKGSFITDVNGHLVKKVYSNAEGKFSVSLSPGEYSLLVKEGDFFFANLFDGNNNIHPVVVNQNKVTETTIKVDYKAAY